MNCPVCDDMRMREVEKDGVLIDICPQCKGVWLDRGELDKLMSGIREIRDDFNTWYNDRDHERHRYDDRSYDHRPPRGYDPYYGQKRKKKSLLDTLGDLFD